MIEILSSKTQGSVAEALTWSGFFQACQLILLEIASTKNVAHITSMVSMYFQHKCLIVEM
jgi:hypothetical protein